MASDVSPFRRHRKHNPGSKLCASRRRGSVYANGPGERRPHEALEALGLPVEAEYRPGIAVHLTVAHQIAQDVLAFETGDDTEPAPVYRP